MMVKEVYVITREGVYRHGILGIFSTYNQAEKEARKIFEIGYKGGDGETYDHYHSIHIGRCKMNESIMDIENIYIFQGRGW